MLDPRLLRENPELVKAACRAKRIGSPELVDAWLDADRRRRAAQLQADTLRAEQKKLGDRIGRLKRDLKGSSSPELEELLKASNDLKARQQDLAREQAAAEAAADEIMLQLPAVPDPSWPVGDDERGNVVLRAWSDPSRPPLKLTDGRRDHMALGRELGILDFERGVKLAGSRSYVVCGQGARLYWAVLRFAQDMIVSRGFTPMVVPVMVTEACMTGTGFFPLYRDQAYITQDGTALVGTSETPLVSYYAGEILKEEELPRRMTALSTCFRREAGAAGKDTAGLYRVHQFDKVEQVVIHRADDAEHVAIHEEILANSEAILRALRLPYRVIQVCTGDMGQGKWRMYDIETWMPGRDSWGETHSCSALRDFQARRLNIRYRPADGGGGATQFCYTLNNTAIACPRILIAILENYQNPDGTVTVPEVLRPYMDGLEVIRKA